MERNEAERNDAPPPNPAQSSEVMPSGVWPPPPTGGPPTVAVAAPQFRPVRRLARILLVLLSVYAVTTVLGIANALLPPLPVGHQIAVGVVAMLQVLLLLGTGVCFLVWTYRLSKNLRALGVAGVRYAPAWAVAYFFIPILSLYRPYQVFREIWRASDSGPSARTGRDWQNGSSPVLLGFWWASVILMNIVDTLSSENAGDTSIDALGNAVGLLSTLFAFQVVRLVTARQEKTARLLSLIR